MGTTTRDSGAIIASIWYYDCEPRDARDKVREFLARLGSRHRPSSGTPPNELPSETVYQWNALVPLDFGAVPQLPTFIRQRRSGVKSLPSNGSMSAGQTL